MKETAETNDRAHEAQVVSRARSGDADALRELVDAHKDRLFAFIWRMIRNHDDAEEICQDAFLKAFASLDSYSTQYRFSTWLFTIGYRVCLNRLRRRRVVTAGLQWVAAEARQESESPEAAFESQDAARMKDQIWSAVDRLTEHQKATVLLFYRHEMGCQEIARVLELPVATVKSHLHRARNRLRELLSSVPDQDLERFRNRSMRTG